LGALTQASVLHVHPSCEHLLPLVDRSLMLLQTTSPSPLLLGSLEAATLQAAATGCHDWADAVSLAEYIKDRVTAEVRCRCLTSDWVRERWGARLDPTRVVVNVADRGRSGLDVAQTLRRSYNIQVEMANLRCVVALISPGNDEQDAEALIAALTQTLAKSPERIDMPRVSLPPAPRVSLPPWEALKRPIQWVPVDEAVGRVSAEIVAPYPPGVPVLIPGEEISREVVEYLATVRHSGWEVRGAAHADLSLVGVVS